MNALARAAESLKRVLLHDEVVARIDENRAQLAELEHYTAHLRKQITPAVEVKPSPNTDSKTTHHA